MKQPRTILLITRDRRLHPMMVGMAANLAPEHRVVVLATPELAGDFAAIDGVEVILHRSRDVLRDGGASSSLDESEARRRIHEIEDRIGLRLYEAARNFVLYGQVVKEFGGYWDYLVDDRDIALAFVEAYDHLSRVFDEIGPDVVFYEAVDLISNYIALSLAIERGIFAFEPRPSPLGHGKGTLGFGIDRRNIVLEHLLSSPDHVQEESLQEGEEILLEPRENLYRTFWSTAHKEMVRDHSPLQLGWWTSRLGDPEHVARGARNYRWHLAGIRNRAWLGRNLERAIPEKPYVAFLLNHLPEASTCSQAPRWLRQDSIVEQLSVNAPAGLQIVVKEHPRTYGRRGRRFFEPLAELPNVTVCHPSVSNFDLLSGAESILSITGTSGFEGIVLGKRVGVLARPFYSVFSGIRRLENPEDLFDHMADADWRPDLMWQERREFIAAYLQSLSDYGSGKGAAFYPTKAGAGWAAALARTLDFIDRHALSPWMFDPGLPRATRARVSEGAGV